MFGVSEALISKGARVLRDPEDGKGLIAAWHTSHRVTVYLIENLPPELWSQSLPGSPRRTNAPIGEPWEYTIQLAGGRIRVRVFGTSDEVAALEEPIVFNCTGLGTRDLFRDRDLPGVKGQLSILLPQVEVDYALATNDLYMFPRRDGILRRSGPDGGAVRCSTLSRSPSSS